MGFQLVDKTASFPNDLGNVNLSETFIKTASITDEKFKTAYRNFYTSFKKAGFFQKFAVARLAGAGAVADSLNLVNPVLGPAAYQATFVNDKPEYHTSAGWTPNKAAGSYARSNFLMKGDLTNFHMHVWNTGPEDSTTTENRFLLSAQSTQNFYVALQRNDQNRTRAAIGSYSSINYMTTNAIPVTRLGLLSASRNGSVGKMYDAGVAIVNSTITDTPVLSGTVEMLEGSIGSSANISSATFRFWGYGFSSWSDTDEITLRDMIAAFNAAIA
ncbi:hypothetical protein [Siphonobacter sp. SORGH_AS_0500]|uniref:hypothetical protein n=1 Tax=Siphonobacter sp. SORGH_AS_0500 TaxID=1864824 RepID=UPI002858F014|nr:hypothetical protein [Siphonobacter sp. SORGH_AS_0500]MDR6195188.1 hypothetical protein [Siphonobacter sp. SORGH_AS_0500]